MTIKPNLYDKLELRVERCDIEAESMKGKVTVVLADANVLSSRNNKINVLRNIENSLKRQSGFLLLRVEQDKATTINMELLKNTEFVLCSRQGNYVLLRKVSIRYPPVLVYLRQENYRWVKELQEALRKSKIDGRPVMLVAQGEFSGVCVCA